MKKKKGKSSNIIHYIQLQTHRKYPNQLNYLSHLEIYHSKLKPITYHIERILNQKWIHIRQSQLIDQFNQIHQQDIQNYFLHKVIFRK